MKQYRSAQQRAEPQPRDPAAVADPSNDTVRAELGEREAEPSILSAAPRGEGLHAGSCGCADCLGGGLLGKHPDFTEVLEDGTVAEGSEAVAAEDIGSTTPAPDLSGSGEAAQAGSWKFGKHPSFPNVYGQTWFNSADLGMAPSVTWDVSRNILPWKEDYTAKPTTTSVGECTWPVIATPENHEGYKVDVPAPGYEGFDHYVIVNGTAADNILGAEQQHVSDLDQGWYLAAVKLADAINAAAAGDGHSSDDPLQAKRDAAAAITSGLGAYGAGLQNAIVSGGSLGGPVETAMTKAFTATQQQRDTTGNHSWGIELYTAHHPEKKVASTVDDDKPLDQTDSSSVVTFDTIA